MCEGPSSQCPSSPSTTLTTHSSHYEKSDHRSPRQWKLPASCLRKSWVLQVAREGGFNSNGDWKGACWQTKCGFQIGGRGRQTKKKSADLRDPTLFFFFFPVSRGCWEVAASSLEPTSLLAALRDDKAEAHCWFSKALAPSYASAPQSGVLW